MSSIERLEVAKNAHSDDVGLDAVQAALRSNGDLTVVASKLNTAIVSMHQLETNGDASGRDARELVEGVWDEVLDAMPLDDRKRFVQDIARSHIKGLRDELGRVMESGLLDNIPDTKADVKVGDFYLQSALDADFLVVQNVNAVRKSASKMINALGNKKGEGFKGVNDAALETFWFAIRIMGREDVYGEYAR